MRNSKTHVLRELKRSLFLLACLFFSSGLLAQTVIKGRLYDNNGGPLSGASVVVKGTTRGSTTNPSGEFSINASPGETLEFSMVGYESQSVKIDRSTGEITLRLQQKLSTVEEIIVIGYGTQKR